MKRFFITCMLSLFWFYPTQAETASTGDYGICAHLQRWEYPVYRQELDIIKELGDLELSSMTPIDALNTLYRLQTKLKNRWQ